VKIQAAIADFDSVGRLVLPGLILSQGPQLDGKSLHSIHFSRTHMKSVLHFGAGLGVVCLMTLGALSGINLFILNPLAWIVIGLVTSIVLFYQSRAGASVHLRPWAWSSVGFTSGMAVLVGWFVLFAVAMRG